MHGLWMIITKCQKESLEFFKEALMTPRTLRQSSMDLVEKKKKSVLQKIHCLVRMQRGDGY